MPKVRSSRDSYTTSAACLLRSRSPEEYSRILQMHEVEGKNLTVCEMEVLGLTHPELSPRL